MKRLLAINFRDPLHPEAGGAELHLEEILLAALGRGLEVTWLASGFPGGPPEFVHRGLRIVRRGNGWNFNAVVPSVLRREFSAPAPDLIVEDINKVPCLTPLWTKSQVAVIVPHLFGTTAFQEASFPVAVYVQMLETLIPAIYRGRRCVVISESTRDDLVARGMASGLITVVHCGMDHSSYTPGDGEKSSSPTILYVGRLRRYKGVDWTLRSMPAVRARVPDARLIVVGDGPDRARLERLAADLGIGDAVEFRGFVPREEKTALLRSSWLLIQPSPKEGWGLTVVEAGACGTAVVAADSPGLRDSVRRDVTGLLVPYGDDDGLATALTRVLADRPLRERLAAGGVTWAARFRWPDCAARSLDALGVPA